MDPILNGYPGRVRRLLRSLGGLLSHPRLRAFLRLRRTRYLAAWLAALVTAGTVLYISWNTFRVDERPDGNAGHTYIDFAGPYTMGRMLLRGHARDLYNRVAQRQVLREAYPRANEVPPEKRNPQDRDTHDLESLMESFMGHDDLQGANHLGSIAAPLGSVGPLELVVAMAAATPHWDAGEFRQPRYARGGPLYPPVNAFLYYPLALLPPQPAYRAAQVLGIAFAFAAGRGLSALARGRVWWPLATIVVLLYPGFLGSLELAQNTPLSFAILVWGWVLIARGHEAAGGMVWGLLAFKPVWALAFFLVPLLSARWRTCAAMVLTGAALTGLTVPAVGWQGWYDWLLVGREATRIYTYDVNWIHLGRDVLTIPRKWLDLDASNDVRRQNLPAAIIGWSVLLLVLETTIRLALIRPRLVRRRTGPGPAFLFFGAWLTCFHFMYYDTTLALLPVFLLFTTPRSYLRRVLVAVTFLRPGRGRTAEAQPAAPTAVSPDGRDYYLPRLARAYPPSPQSWIRHVHRAWVLNQFVPTIMVAMLAAYAAVDLYGPPVETYAAFVLWLWCGWQIGRQRNRPAVARQRSAAIQWLGQLGPSEQFV